MNDREVCQLLANVAEELMTLSERAESLVGETALRTAASTIAGTAKAIHDHLLDGEAH